MLEDELLFIYSIPAFLFSDASVLLKNPHREDYKLLDNLSFEIFMIQLASILMVIAFLLILIRCHLNLRGEGSN